ncbi:hypothetical protein LJ739_18265 [Aestuariibacter halophilus]|uniref:Solute-binding protein family 3/N-terminal domain-containing protein n=1 Tax=Fluctibacter halophilus TaxID=226011 RepID=A0ABS8GCE8_9ALTE|nr:hypothetical protein [Aestuariibacter halophilus]MCC2618207.1 hypothetical protein [Aestuariibacter halophilus]
MRIWHWIIVSCLVVGQCYAQQASPSRPITFGAVLFPPNSVWDADKQACVGHVIRETRRILTAAGLEVDVVCASALRIYRLMEEGEVDFTVNVKSTRAMPEGTLFSDTPYSQLFVELYSHSEDKGSDVIAGIRGYDYDGYRQILINSGFTFIDLPNSLDAIDMFLRGRAKHLISYRGPFQYHLHQPGQQQPLDAIGQTLTTVDTFYAIAANSPHKAVLLKVLSDYAEARGFDYFYQPSEQDWAHPND